jgi:hypothetical protein
MTKFTKFSMLALAVLGYIFLSSCTEKDGVITETIDFESLSLEPESYWDGSDGSGVKVFGMASFNNNYNSDYGAWAGFAFSNVTDIETPGWSNQYSAFVASGGESSNTYAVSYVSADDATITFSSEVNLVSAKVTNSTYTYLTLLNGNDFSRKFEDGDWFMLSIKVFNANDEEIAHEVFYLADYRNSGSKIVDNWTEIDLRGLANVKKIVFHLSSSDNGDWGMNTPAYFCLDDLVFEHMN